ncbi:MAG: glycosyltransferase family 4 protein [Alphaproteobacteria bacterium]
MTADHPPSPTVILPSVILPTIILDVSRLLSRAWSAAPTGIDRVEKAYADALLAADPSRALFVAVRRGRVWRIPRGHVAALSRHLDHQWAERTGDLAGLAQYLDWPGLDWPAFAGSAPQEHHRPSGSALNGRTPILPWRPLGRAPDRGGAAPLYLNVSHHHLDKAALLARIKSWAGARMVVFLHDAIPVQYPEYARGGDAERHRRRLDTVEALADGVIVNSAATAADLKDLMPGLARRRVPLHVEPLWLEDAFRSAGAAPASAPPFFLCVGTIEARKNHTLLLSLWRDLTKRLGPACPRLVLVGQRGWENDTALALLDRCPTLMRTVFEAGPLNDRDLSRLMRSARAVLMPSFAEGFGLPVIEALGAGTPVLASDLPALREVGQGAPDYLSPLDGAGWQDAILAYAAPDSPRRTAQLRRLRGLTFPTRAEHLERAMAWITGQAERFGETETAR